MKKTMIIGADLVPTESNLEFFINCNIEELIGEDLLEIFNSVDYRIFNLEAPLCNFDSPIEKCGPNLKIKEESINGIKELDPTCLVIGNNHILDHGERGLINTIKILNDKNIKYVGAGKNLEEAKKPYIIQDGLYRIGVYSCAENEFSIAENSRAGANPIDFLETPDEIINLKRNCDYLIVLYHGGKELYQYPTPNLQKISRKLVEKGADIVICQHSHCIGAEEEYMNGKIIYGQGNFIFDRNKNKLCDESILVKLSLGEKIEVEYIPIIKQDNVIRLNKNGIKTIENFKNRSEKIKNSEFIEENWKKYCENLKNYYLCSLAGFNRYGFFLNKLFKKNIIQSIYKYEKKLKVKNHLNCESHLEVIRTILDN